MNRSLSRDRCRIAGFAGFLLAGLLAAAALLVALVTTVGRGYCTEKWVPHLFAFKSECLRRSHSPRFVIMSGSNAQHCLDCDELASRLQMDVVCAGLIYRVPVRFYVPILEKSLQPGDVLYLPLETWHYWMKKEELFSPFVVSFVWGVCPRAQWAYSVWDWMNLYLKKGLPWIQCVVPKRLHREFTATDSRQAYEDVAHYFGRPESGYFKPRGDCCGNDETTMDRRLYVQRLPPNLPFSVEFREALESIRAMAKRRGVRVLLGNPAWHSYPWEKRLRAFEEGLSQFGFPVCGDPAALCPPYCCFTDYDLHCNASGRRLLTREIADGLCRLLGKPQLDRTGWPQVVFPSETGTTVRFAQADACVGRPAFGEFFLDRGTARQTNVVTRVLVNGRPVRFGETAYAVKNVLWVWWEESPRFVSVEVETRGGTDCRLERVLMEPDPTRALAEVSGFNDSSPEFHRRDGSPNRFTCVAANGREAYLRVRIPACRTNRRILHLALKGGKSLRAATVGGRDARRRALLPTEITSEGIAVRLALNDSDHFVDGNGDTVAGIYFPANSLRAGDEIILEHLGFEML